LKKYGFPAAPIVLGMVLGGLAETNFRRAVIMGGYDVFFTRPVSLLLLLVALFSFGIPLFQSWKETKKESIK
jgi:putative tricarboxylic transport membrane protein